MDKIEIRDLEIFANHGVFPEETALGQKFVVSAIMYTETRPAGLTDDLSASINYGEVSHMITDFLQKNTYKLLEAAVENLAEMLLLTLPLLKKITLRIEKPWAPVSLPLKTVAVEITRGWHTAFIAFGSNMGDKKKYLDNAIQGLRDMKEIVVEKVSGYLVTEPYGGVEQDEFLNGVLKLRTLLTPEELDTREAELTARLARIEELEAQAIRREKAAKEREKAKKQVLLRLSPSLWDDIAAWAEDDFRSINAQIEFLLTEAVRRRKKGEH